jgi:hypothetical protein
MFPGGLRRRWRDPDGMIHEWDYRHGMAMAYFVQTTAAAINPTWTMGVGGDFEAAIVSFKHL